MNNKTVSQEGQLESLNLHDLLIDERSDILSDYLTISISSDGQNTNVVITTTDDSPTEYTSALQEVSALDIHTLLNDNSIDVSVDI